MNLLKHLVVKPTHQCNQNCPYCLTRKKTFKKSGDRELSLDDWIRVFHEADELGNLYLDISGGEPTLYKHLIQLILEAKKLGWFVSMNTNGTLLTAELLKDLEKVYLDQVIVSCISLDEATNDRARKGKNTLHHVKKCIDMLSSSSIRCIFHCIVCKYNFREIASIIEYSFLKKINSLSLVYPENAYYEKYIVLKENQIREFREKILPGIISCYSQVYRRCHNTPPAQVSLDRLKKFYSKNPADLEKGIYFQRIDENPCKKPDRFILVYANGDILPCNGVEYTAAPVVGNVKKSSLQKIWTGPEFADFRKNRMNFCKYCPIPDHTGIPIMTEKNPPYTAEVSRKPIILKNDI
jgi:MoaA/NifB/PqqE/SkfB family radical SAM enzyme